MIFMRIEQTKVNQMNIKKDMKVSELMEEFENCGVLGLEELQEPQIYLQQ